MKDKKRSVFDSKQLNEENELNRTFKYRLNDIYDEKVIVFLLKWHKKLEKNSTIQDCFFLDPRMNKFV